MINFLIIILLLIVIIYLFYQNRKLSSDSDNSDIPQSKIFELDEDLIAEKDLAIRERNEAQAESLSLSNRLKLKQQEVTRKERENERLKKESSQKEITLNQKIKDLKVNHQSQLKAINLLFDAKAKDYQEIDFNGLYKLLEGVVKERHND